MEIFRIEDSGGTNEIENARLKSGVRWCLFYKEETCSAPHTRFKLCRSCSRIDPQAATLNLFGKIKDLAVRLFNLQDKGPEPPLPGSSPPSQS